MSALPVPDFTLNSPQELAAYLRESVSWREIEALTDNYAHWKEEAWELLSDGDRDRIKTLKRWKDSAIVQKFPIGTPVQRLDDTENLMGKVINYWQAHGVDYITFQVGQDTDWCRASNLKRVLSNGSN
jgi:glutamine cyclotransferase